MKRKTMCQKLAKKLFTLAAVIALMAFIFPLGFACNSENKEIYILTIAVDGGGTTNPVVGDHAYAGNSEVDITATPITGLQFVKWIGDVADPNSAETTVTMDGDKTVSASFAPPAYDLDISVDPEGSGSVTLGPSEDRYPSGREVKITAIPASGYTFDHWSGDLSGNSNPTTITMDLDKIVTAHFAELSPVSAPALGTEWVYDVSYGAETTEWTVTVTGEATIDSVDCYITDFSYSTPLVRVMNEMELTVTGVKMWMSQATLDGVRRESATIISGDLMTVYLFSSYTGDHGTPLFIGKEWILEETGTLTTTETPLFNAAYDVDVVAQGDVTVPAGTFNCYRIDYSLDGQLEWTEWWSADIRGTVKIIVNEIYDGMQSLELTSYTPG
ncbi:hypothetical protein ACFLW2_00220 [Chloroflexota bacterium]